MSSGSYIIRDRVFWTRISFIHKSYKPEQSKNMLVLSLPKLMSKKHKYLESRRLTRWCNSHLSIYQKTESRKDWLTNSIAFNTSLFYLASARTCFLVSVKTSICLLTSAKSYDYILAVNDHKDNTPVFGKKNRLSTKIFEYLLATINRRIY